MIEKEIATGCARAGLCIYMFIDPDFSTSETQFSLTHEEEDDAPDPRPYLRAAISALEAELAGVENCPIHGPLA